MQKQTYISISSNERQKYLYTVPNIFFDKNRVICHYTQKQCTIQSIIPLINRQFRKLYFHLRSRGKSLKKKTKFSMLVIPEKLLNKIRKRMVL